MIQPPSDTTTEYTIRARRFAALSGPFEPGLLPEVIGGVPVEETLAIAADLAEACDTRHGAEAGRWLMRGTVRHHELDALAATGELAEAIAWRRSLPLDDASGDLLDALTGIGEYGEGAVRAALDQDASRERLERIAVALDRAGPHAPAQGALDAVRSALGRLEVRARASATFERGFFGRAGEVADIEAWLARPSLRPPVTALFVTGLPGIGKSTLVDEAARRATSATPPWVMVRLDFDRAGLDVQDRVGLTMEIARQVSIELGDHAAPLRHARLAAAGGALSPDPDVKGERREHIPAELSGALGDAVRAGGRAVLLIVDTMEILRGRGETHPGRLFDCLDELCDRGLSPLSVIAAGRGDALDSAPHRLGKRIALEGLEAAAADELLARLEVPTDAFADIRELAEGNPLVLRLAALAVRDAGPQALDRATGRREVAAAYLYRFLLSRIADPQLRRLARPGLVVRRINADVIGEVLAPKLRLGRLAPGDAAQLFETLSTHHWLVEPDPSAPGWVRHRSDIRSVLLRLLYRESPATAAQIDRAAAAWFGHRPEPFAPVEAAYHRLQAMRRDGELPSVDPEVLRRFDNETIAELPPEAQDFVHLARGERTSQFRAGSEPTDELATGELAAAARELEAILERGDVIEARYVYDRAFADRPLDPRSAEADVVRTFLWRAGRWRASIRLLRKQGAVGRSDADLVERSPMVALAGLEMRAETDFAGLVRTFAQDPSLRGFADDLRSRGFKGALASGALGFALLRAGKAPSKASWDPFDPVHGAEAAWAERPTQSVGSDALSGALSRLQARVSPRPNPAQHASPEPRPARLPDLASPAGAARLLALLTPYGSPAEALRSLEADGRILRHLAGVDFELSEQGGLPPSGAGDWSIAPAVSPEGSIENIAALGLLAEWLGAAAFVLRHPDLRLLAQSAERWRRTTAGQWGYGSPTASERPWWREPDATIADRLAALVDAPDPVDAARRQLALWFGESDNGGVRAQGRIDKRLPGAVRAARAAARTDNATGAAIELLRRGVPSAFVPPLAVLFERDGRDRRRSK